MKILLKLVIVVVFIFSSAIFGMIKRTVKKQGCKLFRNYSNIPVITLQYTREGERGFGEILSYRQKSPVK